MKKKTLNGVVYDEGPLFDYEEYPITYYYDHQKVKENLDKIKKIQSPSALKGDEK